MQVSQLFGLFIPGQYWQAPTAAQLEVEAKKIAFDSREVGAGTIFVAVQGTQVDGHDFLEQVFQQEPAAVIVQKDRFAAWLARHQNFSTSVLVYLVEDTRRALDFVARRFFHDPSQRLLCVGVTGTNGKTSTVYLLEHLFNKAGLPTGVLGTIDHHFGEEVWPSSHTTPDPVRLQGRLAEMKSLGAVGVAMEVSSHALAQHRVDGVQFNTVIFTNLTRDHLDYHQTEEAYFEAKQRLFTDLLWSSHKIPLFAIVNADDPWGRRLRVSSAAGLWTFGEAAECDFRFQITHMDFSGTDFELQSPFGRFQAKLPMIGRHNVYNAVGAVAALATFGVTLERSLANLIDFPGVPGRLQRVKPESSRFVYVDYAHTPDALQNVLSTLNRIREASSAIEKPRILTLFGCGGDRDRGKRPLMAKAALAGSDFVLGTSDNPRSEDPVAILEEVETGLAPADRARYERQVDRAMAIREIIGRARPGDVVLIAGKGHEVYQEIRGERRDFSDLVEARKALEETE